MNIFHKNFAEYIMKQVQEKVYVYLPGASTKAAAYDKFRDVGYSKGVQNPLVVNAWVRNMVTNELIVKQIGLVSIGAIKIIVKNADVNLLQLATRIVYKNEDYYAYSDAVGKKMLMINLKNNYTEITLWKKDV
jgi:hypothetical protein